MHAPPIYIARRWRLLAACVMLWALDTRPAAAADSHAAEPKAAAAKKSDDSHAKAEAAEAESKPPAKGHGKGMEKVIEPASDKGGERGTEKSAERAADKASGHSASSKAAKAAPQDPMDKLRERLAEKLGATPATNSHVMRVAARSPAPAATSHAASPAPAMRVSAAPAAPAGLGLASAPASAGHAPHWDYKGDAGPESWGRLKAEFSQCAAGTRQSPIDIRDGIKVQLDAVQFDYKPSGFRVIDNGHTVQVNVAGGNSIEVIGRRYDLVQFHFHRPSEERINGRQFDMVAHLVHKDVEGRLAVVAVLLDRGSAHPIVQTVWNNLPLEKGEEVAARPMLDLAALLPTDRSYFTYMGSLTTPPCSEGVLWMVMKNPVPISTEQIAVFSRLYPMNARPIQSVSGRLIKESN